MAVSFEVCVHGDACFFFRQPLPTLHCAWISFFFLFLPPWPWRNRGGKVVTRGVEKWICIANDNRRDTEWLCAWLPPANQSTSPRFSSHSVHCGVAGHRPQRMMQLERFYVSLATDLFDFGDGFITTPARPGPGHGSLLARDIILLAQCSETCLIELNNYCDVGRVCGSVVPVRSWWFRDGCVCWCFACKLAPSLQFAFDGNERVWTFPLNRSTENGTICLIKGIANL